MSPFPPEVSVGSDDIPYGISGTQAPYLQNGAVEMCGLQVSLGASCDLDGSRGGKNSGVSQEASLSESPALGLSLSYSHTYTTTLSLQLPQGP